MGTSSVHAVGTCILTINAGSSSIKFALFALSPGFERLLAGRIGRIGLTQPTFEVTGLNDADNFSKSISASNHKAAVEILMDWIEERFQAGELAAVGHRIVHGGPKFSEPEPVTPEFIDKLHQLQNFDPEHMPQEILLMETFQRRFHGLVQVGCFDTAFHHNLPRLAQMLSLPRRYEADGIRRYGFHGLSYAFLISELENIAGLPAAKGRVVLAHLGSGASLAAIFEGHSMDTSMGLTPAGGVLMSTRSGDLDPGLIWYLEGEDKLTARKFNEMVNFQSGLLGISETSSDMQVLLAKANEDVRASEAVALFCYQIKKYIGAYAAVLGGLDTLVFAGGIGENAPRVRALVCAGMEFLGIELDNERNLANHAIISADSSRVTVRVIHTDEELMIAKSVCQLLGLKIPSQ